VFDQKRRSASGDRPLKHRGEVITIHATHGSSGQLGTFKPNRDAQRPHLHRRHFELSAIDQLKDFMGTQLVQVGAIFPRS
jgi:hypothetical protein